MSGGKGEDAMTGERKTARLPPDVRGELNRRTANGAKSRNCGKLHQIARYGVKNELSRYFESYPIVSNRAKKVIGWFDLPGELT